MSLNLSFSMRAWIPKVSPLVLCLVAVGALGPPAYLAWWGVLGGRDQEIRRGIERLLATDMEAEARQAIARADFRLYAAGGVYTGTVPGFAYTSETYRKRFGYLGFRVFGGNDLDEERQQLNRMAIAQLAIYNRIVYAQVLERFPDWHAAPPTPGRESRVAGQRPAHAETRHPQTLNAEP